VGLSSSDSVSNGLDSFGIPEFEPGKPWKGPGMKNPDEDPNLTPGSMAPTPIDINALSKATSQVNLQSASSAENSLGLTGSTWSFGGSSTDLKPNASKADGWNGPSLSTASSSSNLTPMGQDLWGKSGTGRTPPGLSGNDGGSGWPSSNGWNGSGAQNGASADGMMNGGNGQCWLLLKNLTPQIDGMTLKTLCMQHGPLKQFHLNHSIALVMYGSGREAQKVSILIFFILVIFFSHSDSQKHLKLQTTALQSTNYTLHPGGDSNPRFQ
jgi:trinucleotide repeat-containing gene 6 protein